MATLIDSLTDLIAPATGQIAAKLGESEAAVAHGVTTTLGSVFGGLLNKTKDPAAFGQIFDVISSAPPSANLEGDLQTSVETMGATAGVATSSATNFLDMLFGGGTTAVAELLGRTVGFRNPASVTSLLSFATPMVLNFLGKRVHEDGLNADSLARVLASERDSIVAAAPPEFMDVLGSAPEPRFVEEEIAITPVPGDKPYVGDTRSERSGKWLWPAVGIAAAILAWIAISVSRPHRVAERVSARVSAIDTVKARPGGIVDTAGGEVTTPISPLGALGMRRLPGGIILTVPAYGMESRVVGFIEGAQPVSEHSTFDFDRLTFAQGTARILPESQEQLKNVASIMQAYPNVTVKVEGFSDIAGAPRTNLKLSQQRANAVKQALVASGIPSNRITAEAGGVRNRRVALEVTHK